MSTYQQNINQFKLIQNKYKNSQSIEDDIPFLFEKQNNKTGILILYSSHSICDTYQLGKQLFEKGYTVMGGAIKYSELNNNSHLSLYDFYNSAMIYLNILKNLTEKVYVMGVSFSGSLAYILGIENSNYIDGVIALSVPTYNDPIHAFNFSYIKQVHFYIKSIQYNIQNLDIPLLIMHGVDDKLVKVDQAFFAFDNVKTKQKKLMIYNQICHTRGFSFNNDEIANDITNFINSYDERRPVRFELKDSNVKLLQEIKSIPKNIMTSSSDEINILNQNMMLNQKVAENPDAGFNLIRKRPDFIEKAIKNAESRDRFLINLDNCSVLDLRVGNSNKYDVINTLSTLSKINYEKNIQESIFYFTDIGLTFYFDNNDIIDEIEIDENYKKPTRRGLKINDTFERVVELYGKPKMKSEKAAIWSTFSILMRYKINEIMLIRLKIRE